MYVLYTVIYTLIISKTEKTVGKMTPLDKISRQKITVIFNLLSLGALRGDLGANVNEVCTFYIGFKRRVVPHLTIQVYVFVGVFHT